jgi:hypothetical protein
MPRVRSRFLALLFNGSFNVKSMACARFVESAVNCKVLLILTASLISDLAFASADCAETVMNVISHSSGQVFFTTDQTCPANWCYLNWSTPDAIKNGYAMLLSAKTSGKRVSFRWNSISSCSTVNAVYASPDFMAISE